MKIVSFSDTHMQHEKVNLPKCDLAIFAGDFTHRGKLPDAKNFLDWYSKQTQCKHKVFIAGNHDICADSNFDWETGADLWWENLLEEYSELIYLENNTVEIEGLRIWGSPITPWFHGDYWAFNKYRGWDNIGKVWENIPQNSDIVITHGPPYGILDVVPDGNNVGCEDLLKTLLFIKPKLHIFGHIHCDHQDNRIVEQEGITFINASCLNNNYQFIQQPVKIEI